MTTTETRPQIVAPSQWGAAIARYEIATDLYNRFKRDVLSPAEEMERAFEELHGLSKDAPDYFQRKRELQKAHAYQKPSALEETADKLCDEMSEAEGVVMATPAPDQAALLLKLEKLLAITNGGTDGWSEAYASRTVEDMRRLLK